MNRPLRIAVKYCGGCNTAIERGELVSRLAEILSRQKPDWQLVLVSDEPWDVLLLVNGCAIGCIGKQFENEKRPILRVAGEWLQRKKLAEKSLPQAIYQALSGSEKLFLI